MKMSIKSSDQKVLQTLRNLCKWWALNNSTWSCLTSFVCRKVSYRSVKEATSFLVTFIGKQQVIITLWGGRTGGRSDVRLQLSHNLHKMCYFSFAKEMEVTGETGKERPKVEVSLSKYQTRYYNIERWDYEPSKEAENKRRESCEGFKKVFEVL